MGLSAGMAADLLTGWDLSLASERQRCRKQLARERPRLLIASPPCTFFSVLRNLSNYKRDPEVVAHEEREGEEHLEFSMEQCEEQ
eukprot:15623215-Heterocapsa_arctica.AAC.1